MDNKVESEIEDLIFHEFNCIHCDSDYFRVVILRVEEGVYALNWICALCGGKQPAIPLAKEQIKGLIKIDTTKKVRI